jgi:NADH-quinone oxidoreductase subunit C
MTAPAGLAPDRVAAALAPLGEVASASATRHSVLVEEAKVRAAIPYAFGALGLDRFVQLAALDTGDAIELRYVLSGPHGALVTLRTRLGRDRPRTASVHDLLPPAALYERQVHDLFGVEFAGHPRLDRLLLADDFPAGVFPLRKEKPPPAPRRGGR